MNLRNCLAALAMTFGAAALSAQYSPEVNRYGTDVISDLALIYAGADTRPQWTVEEVMPYVIHTYADGHQDWFFDGFLILEFHSGSTGIAYQNGLNGKPANKEEWETMMRNQMRPLISIDSVINIGKATLGKPRLRHKAVMTIPAAIKNQTCPFGEIDGREMDFSKEEDRLAAEKWAVKKLIEIFNEANLENIDLTGIYWVEEGLYTNGPILPQVNDWIYRHGLRSYWIPYYPNNAQFALNWKNYGFDMAYLQPNYFFKRDVPYSQLVEASEQAKKYGMGLEVEFESQGTSRVSHSDPDSYYDRLVAYLDEYEKNGVFEESDVAWYSGTKGYLDLARSSDPKDHEILDRMASIVAKRQAAKASSLKWPKNEIRDLALIYQGGVGRIDWTEKDFEPYVVHKFADGTRDWLFDGYLFLDSRAPEGKSLATTGRKNGANKELWQWYMDRVYEPGKSLDALDKCIGRMKKEVGDPGFKHKIVLNLVVPDWGQEDWGELNGKKLDFNNDDDRVAASKWYIDQMIQRFNDAKYENLELFGIYYHDEDLIFCHDFPKLIAPYVHEKGLEFSWIPYFKARGYERHKEMGFDVTYMQPNYFFDDMSKKRFDETIDIAKLNGMLVEFECDGDALSQNPNTKYWKLMDYIEAFERNGLFDECPIAYYTGSKMFIQMRDNPSPANQAIMDRLCRHIVNRRLRMKPKPDATVTTDGNGALSYSTSTPWSGEIKIDFANCMANNLFTFSNVSLDGTTVNHTDSDNIGPFGLASGGWIGGNHLNNNIRSARTEAVTVFADGNRVDLTKAASLPCDVLTIKVFNTLLMPESETPFAYETVTYTVKGNSVDVVAEHSFVCSEPIEINRYYGMQSMFIGENEILTPGGKYSSWTPTASVDRFDKVSAGHFDTFIEHSPAGYQAAWLDRSFGLGDRSMIDNDDWAFIGNSYSKSYHKTIGNRKVKNGDRTAWHGVYTWFKEPIADYTSETVPSFAYAGSADGQPVVFFIDETGRTSLRPLTSK